MGLLACKTLCSRDGYSMIRLTPALRDGDRIIVKNCGEEFGGKQVLLEGRDCS